MVRVLLFASVIAICFVFSLGFSDCSVPIVFFLLIWMLCWGLVVSGLAHRRRKVQRNRVVCNLASCSSEWVVVVVVVLFSLVLEISEMLYFFCVCVFDSVVALNYLSGS